MKHLLRVLSIVVFIGFVFGVFLGLQAEEKALTCSKEAKKDQCKATCSASCKEVCCPICKTKVDKEKSEFRTEYKDGVYYFCSEKCKAEFDANPTKYEQGCHYKYVYVCMTDKEKYAQPGKCPKCGTELRKTEAKVCTCVEMAKGGCQAAAPCKSEAPKGECKHATETQTK
ncbi:MAG: YHS domain-containing protein [Candidatus Omnitrophota bacterium]